MIEYLPLLLLLALLVLGVPVAFALVVSGVAGISLITSWSTAMTMMAMLPHRIVATYVLIAIPLFLFFGFLAERTGIITGTFDSAKKWVGRLPGGLGIATTSASGVFAAASGSSVSSCVVFGSLAVPEMRRAGYSKSISMGTVASAGLLASTIPPSLTLILYGMLSETSIIQLFTAGLVPGLLQLLVIILTIWLLYLIRRHHFPPDSSALRYSLGEKIRSMVGIWPLLSVAVAILASIYLGIATVTESAAAGVVVALLIVFIQRRATFAIILDAARRTVETTAMIMFILVGGLVFGTYVAMTDLATQAVATVSALPLSGPMVLLLLIPVFLLLGCFLDGASILVLTIPILMPIAVFYEIDPIFLGIYMTFCIELGALTPPVGINVYAVKGTVPDATLEETFRAVLPFFLMLLALLILLVFQPGLVTWLPEQMRLR